MASKSSDSVSKSGRGGEQDRLSQSPQAIRHANADPSDTHDSKVTSETGDLGYDKNTRKSYGTDP